MNIESATSHRKIPSYINDISLVNYIISLWSKNIFLLLFIVANDAEIY